MSWWNGPRVVYHGTDNLSATAIRHSGIDSASFRPRKDFGAGFYVTSVFHQAKQWANQRVRRTAAARNAEVLEYALDWDDVASLNHLVFVVDGQDYYDFVAFCRAGNVSHGRRQAYDVVYGPVSLWPQKLAIANCDQLLFSDPKGIPGFAFPSQSRSPPHQSKFF